MKRCLLGLFALLICGFVTPAMAERRVALVVGNSAYRSVEPLDNPANDAVLMAATLRELGFELTGNAAQINLDKGALDRAVQDFGRQIQGAEVALFYYAGHGVQVRGSNFLVPVDAKPTREVDVDFQMVDVNLVLNQMQASGTRLNLLLLDACRNNPFGAHGLRAIAGGLAQLRAPDGTLISYATQPGNVAQDGADGHSPYTKALSAIMKHAGLDVFRTFNEVGLAVKRATGGEQEPWVSTSPIDGDFYFTPPAMAGTQNDVPAANPPSQQEGRLSSPTRTPTSDSVTDCDRLAADPTDAMRARGVAGVRPDRISVASALAACDAAMRQYPAIERFTYQAGRVAVVQRDFTRARQLFEAAATSGYAASYMGLADLYRDGKGVPRDYAEARKSYEKAAALGEPYAMRNLGVLCEEGHGATKDYAEARKWYEKAATSGDTPAMDLLGILYQDGKGVPRDYAEARKWFEKAATSGDTAAMDLLGILYRDGNGVPRDYAEARRWHEKAAALGEPYAMRSLGILYEEGHGATQDYAEARRWYQKAAASGDTGAMDLLGILYRDGKGVPKDPVQARGWFEKALAAGNPNGARLIGRLYETGNGVPRDYAEARKWYEKAAAGGEPRAMELLGTLYRDGKGVPRDPVQARGWFDKALAAGNADASLPTRQLEVATRNEVGKE